MKIIKGDLIMTEDMTFNEDLKVEGNIFGKNGITYNLTAWDITARDINAGDITARDINFYADATAYRSFKCKSWKAIRENFIIKCLDGEVEITGNKVCEVCGK